MAGFSVSTPAVAIFMVRSETDFSVKLVIATIALAIGIGLMRYFARHLYLPNHPREN